LQKQGIFAVAGIQQQDVAACTNAADADYLQCEINEPIALQQCAAIDLQSLDIGMEKAAEHFAQSFFGNPAHQRHGD
jgi:hypothetical protein